MIEHVVLRAPLSDRAKRGQRRQAAQLAHLRDLLGARGTRVHRQRAQSRHRQLRDPRQRGGQRAQLAQPQERLHHPVGVRLHRPASEPLKRGLGGARRDRQDRHELPALLAGQATGDQRPAAFLSALAPRPPTATARWRREKARERNVG